MTPQGDAIREIAKALEGDMAGQGNLANVKTERRVMDLYAAADEVDQAIESMAQAMDEQGAELDALRNEEAA